MSETIYTSKVALTDGRVIMDISQDTVTAPKLLSGETAHGSDGAPIIGTCTYDADTSSDTALATEILNGRTAHARGTAITGTMPNRGAVTGAITDAAVPYTIQQGFHDGTGSVSVSSQTLIAGNIKSGVDILGVVGTYAGEQVTAQAKTVTPSLTSQTILPDQNYDYLSQVNVNAIPINYTLNAAGGYTVTIG